MSEKSIEKWIHKWQNRRDDMKGMKLMGQEQAVPDELETLYENWTSYFVLN